jgi:ribosomal protein S6
MNGKYEFVFLTAPDMKKDRREEVFKRLETRIKKAKAEVTEKEQWREKKLSYPMKKNNSASFWIWHLESEQQGFDISPVTTYLNRQDDVLRYLLLTSKEEE